MLPAAYVWLAREAGPKLLLEMLKLYGTVEAPGSADNPTILAWAKECGIAGYSHDAVPWCGLTMAVAAHRAGYPIPARPLRALDWAKWGNEASVPMLGDVLVFKRDGGGHVTLYVGEDAGAYHCMGGNQSDRVNVTRIAKARLHAARRSPFCVAQPANVRRVHLAAGGALSTNEA
jgi:uncharacterized protein (TIGR02594 family)